jgi:hypothetical protein
VPARHASGSGMTDGGVAGSGEREPAASLAAWLRNSFRSGPHPRTVLAIGVTDCRERMSDRSQVAGAPPSV